MLVWKFALSLFLSSLKIAHIKEHLWAIRSRRSLKKSDCEQIALDFFKKCKVSNSLVIWENRSKQWVICSKKHIFCMFLTVFSPLFYAQKWIAPIALRSVTLYKRATASDSLPSLMTKERWGLLALFHEPIALSLTKNKQFAWKTDEQISNPEFMCNRYCTSVL